MSTKARTQPWKWHGSKHQLVPNTGAWPQRPGVRVGRRRRGTRRGLRPAVGSGADREPARPRPDPPRGRPGNTLVLRPAVLGLDTGLVRQCTHEMNETDHRELLDVLRQC